jgi:hypothetical protein
MDMEVPLILRSCARAAREALQRLDCRFSIIARVLRDAH